MTRRERLEQKLDKRREWAQTRKAKAAAAFKAADNAVAGIPFGQPILVGHHSERHHQRALDKHDNAMRRGCESQDMAAHHISKAGGLEHQLTRSVFSDDVDAVEQLTAKIADAEKLQEVMRAVNAIVRRKPKNESTPEKVVELLALGLKEGQVTKLFTPDFMGRYGFPSYATTNNNANIRRMKQRIEEIERRQARSAVAADTPAGILVEGEGEYVSITFAEKPAREVLNALKAAGFWWGGGSWSGKRANIPAEIRDLAPKDTGSTTITPADQGHIGTPELAGEHTEPINGPQDTPQIGVKP
ncbi:MAG: DUF3560 domain-containing protein [Thermoguttaceae bacterium]|jgi:phage shock protein A